MVGPPRHEGDRVNASTAAIRLPINDTRVFVARAVWICAALGVGTLFVAGTPVTFAHLHVACTALPCLNWQLTPAAMQELQRSNVPLDLYAGYIVGIDLASALVWLAVGGILVWKAPTVRMALVAAFFLVLFRGATFGGIVATLGATETSWQWPVRIVEFFGQSAIIPFFYVFPNGRFAPSWTRWLAVIGISAQIPSNFLFTGIWSRVAWADPILLATAVVAYAGLPLAQTYRYRHISSPIERQQTKWVVFAVVIAITFTLFVFLLVPPATSPRRTAFNNVLGDTLWNVTFLPIPLAIAVSVLRYRLWDIDLVINRALVYATLTASVVGLYVLVVGGVGELFQMQGNLMLSLLGAGLVAMLFQPLRARLQRAVNRLMYGERDDPYRVITRLGERLEATLSPEAVLPTIVETTSQALRLPYAAIALKDEDGFSVVASAGERSPSALSLPLLYSGETVGHLLVSPRPGDAGFSPTDRRLLNDLARQVGIAAHSVLLSSALQRSRERLVTTREEERRRLRRDLHDGLGPALASFTLKLDAARNLVRRDPNGTERLLLELKGQVQGAITDIRRLVYALRPPTLDELGLVSAIHEQAEQYRSNGLAVSVEASDPLPPLPAAVEVAVYRIVQEALTNVARHSGARRCTIRLSSNGSVELEVADNGRGLNGARPGVGLSSMRERAEELGGSCTIGPGADGGTRVLVRLPIPSLTHGLAATGSRE